MSKGRGRPQPLEKASDRFAPLALLEAVAAQFAPNPLIQALEFKPTRRKAVEDYPTNEKQVMRFQFLRHEFDDYLGEADAPVPTGNLLDLLLSACHAFG